MPHIFNIYKEIMNIDIGTIIIYSCEKCCRSFEEEVYIQRTGESLIETDGDKIKLITGESNLNTNNKSDKPKKTEEVDEDGFTIVRNKKKKNN